MVTREQVKQLLALEEQATEGPWEYTGCVDKSSVDPYDREGYVKGPSVLSIPDTMAYEPNDAEWIAQSRNLMPQLARDWLRMRGALESISKTTMSMGYQDVWELAADLKRVARQALSDTADVEDGGTE